MNEKTSTAIHWSFWVISIIGLIWNALGGVNYIMQTNAEFVATLPDTHRAIIEGRPAWATGGFALTVFGGAVGCLLLLLRNSAAMYLFIVSLLGVIVTMVHTLRVGTTVIEFDAAEVFVMIVLPVIVAGLLLWYARHAQIRGWIK